MCEALVSQPYKMDVVVCACNPSTGDLKLEDQKSKVIFGYKTSLMSSLDIWDAILKTNTQINNPQYERFLFTYQYGCTSFSYVIARDETIRLGVLRNLHGLPDNFPTDGLKISYGFVDCRFLGLE